jgi:hypothetical protein
MGMRVLVRCGNVRASVPRGEIYNENTPCGWRSRELPGYEMKLFRWRNICETGVFAAPPPLSRKQRCRCTHAVEEATVLPRPSLSARQRRCQARSVEEATGLLRPLCPKASEAGILLCRPNGKTSRTQKAPRSLKERGASIRDGAMLSQRWDRRWRRSPNANDALAGRP